MNTEGFWGDAMPDEAWGAVLQLSAMGLVLAVCALGVAIILAVAVNEWQLWRRARKLPVRQIRPWEDTSVAMERHRREADPRDSIVFDWDWPAA